MKSNRSRKFILAVVFSSSLALGAGAEAGNLFALGGDFTPKASAERQVGLFEQALNWLTGAWTDMTGLKTATSQSSSTPPPPSGPACESGWGLDPIGCPRP